MIAKKPCRCRCIARPPGDPGAASKSDNAQPTRNPETAPTQRKKRRKRKKKPKTVPAPRGADVADASELQRPLAPAVNEAMINKLRQRQYLAKLSFQRKQAADKLKRADVSGKSKPGQRART